MTRKSRAVFKMAGYTYPGTSPVTKKGGPETKKIDVDNLSEKKESEKVSKKVSKKTKRDNELIVRKVYDIDGNVIGGYAHHESDDITPFDPYTD
jgi:hypothetical protein